MWRTTICGEPSLSPPGWMKPFQGYVLWNHSSEMSNSNSERVEGIADISTPSLRPLKLITCEYSHVYSMEPVSYASVFLSGNSFINASGFKHLRTGLVAGYAPGTWAFFSCSLGALLRSHGHWPVVPLVKQMTLRFSGLGGCKRSTRVLVYHKLRVDDCKTQIQEEYLPLAFWSFLCLYSTCTGNQEEERVVEDGKTYDKLSSLFPCP